MPSGVTSFITEIQNRIGDNFEEWLPIKVALFGLCHSAIGTHCSWQHHYAINDKVTDVFKLTSGVDAALSLLLHCKSLHVLSAQIFQHRRQIVRAKGSSASAAIHAVVRGCESGHAKWLLLFEIMLREGALTALSEETISQKVHSPPRGMEQRDELTQTIVKRSLLDQVIETNNIALRNVIKYAVDINDSDESALFVESSSQEEEMDFRQVVRQVKWAPIHLVIAQQDIEMLKWFVSRGARLDAYKTNVDDGYNWKKSGLTALYMICKNDSQGCPMLKAVLSALKNDVDVNKTTNALSRFAKGSGICGVDTSDDDDSHERSEDENATTDVENKTALYVAVETCNVEMVKLLLVVGADPLRCAMVRSGEIHKNMLEKRARWGDRLTALQILERQGDSESKRQIAYILKSNSRWFPELIDFYPGPMLESLSAILEALSEKQFPNEIASCVLAYFIDYGGLKDEWEETEWDSEYETDSDQDIE